MCLGAIVSPRGDISFENDRDQAVPRAKWTLRKQRNQRSASNFEIGGARRAAGAEREPDATRPVIPNGIRVEGRRTCKVPKRFSGERSLYFFERYIKVASFPFFFSFSNLEPILL